MTRDEVLACLNAQQALPILEQDIQALQDFLNGKTEKEIWVHFGVFSPLDLGPQTPFGKDTPAHGNTGTMLLDGADSSSKPVATGVLSAYLAKRSEFMSLIARFGEERIQHAADLLSDIEEEAEQLKACESIRENHSKWNVVVFGLMDEDGKIEDASSPIDVSPAEQFAFIKQVKENLSKSLAYHEMELRSL